MIPARASLAMIESDDGPLARLQFPDVAFTVDPQAVSFINGELRVQVPSYIDVPQDVVVVERWLPPTALQVRLAVEALNPALVETLILQMQADTADESFGVLAVRAVALACAGTEDEAG